MKNLRIGILILMILGLLAPLTASAQRKTKKKSSRKAKPAAAIKDAPIQPPPAAGDFKILASGEMSQIEEPFIFVARDAATYELLKRIAPDLPAAATVDFQQNSVVAAFLGTKPTAGYGISIQQTANGAKVSAIDKPAGAMTAQVLTAPYKIAVVPADNERELPLEIGADWTRRAEVFRVTSGEFEFSGGLISTEKKFSVGGTISVWRTGDLITVDFNVAGKNADANLRMDEVASGETKAKDVNLPRVDPGGLIASPRPALKATGIFDGGKISFSFEPLRSIYSDGFSGTGKFEAVK